MPSWGYFLLCQSSLSKCLSTHLPLSDRTRLVPGPVRGGLSGISLLEMVALQLWADVPPAFLQDRLWLRAEAAVLANGVCTRRSNADRARLVQSDPYCSQFAWDGQSGHTPAPKSPSCPTGRLSCASASQRGLCCSGKHSHPSAVPPSLDTAGQRLGERCCF